MQYAPKDKQTRALCSTPPLSICDSEYGLSVGRGSFRFAAGNWTHVRQTVTLNTPGMQDGAFTLDVNGVRVIDRSDVFYRDVPTLLALGRREPSLGPAPASDPSTEQPERPPPIGIGLGVARVPSFLVKPGAFPAAALTVDPPAASPDMPMIVHIAGRDSDITPVFAPSRNVSGDPPVPAPAPASGPGPGPGTLASTPVPVPLPLSTSTITVTSTSTVTVMPPPQTVIVAPARMETVYVVAVETGIGASPDTAGVIAAKVGEPVGFSGLFFRCVALRRCCIWLRLGLRVSVALT